MGDLSKRYTRRTQQGDRLLARRALKRCEHDNAWPVTIDLDRECWMRWLLDPIDGESNNTCHTEYCYNEEQSRCYLRHPAGTPAMSATPLSPTISHAAEIGTSDVNR